MPTLRFGKVWQVIRGVVFCYLGTPKTVISNFVPTRRIETLYSSPCKYGHPNNVPGGQKRSRRKKVSFIFVLIPWYPISHHTIASYGFFLALTGPYPTLQFGGACGLGVGAF